LYFCVDRFNADMVIMKKLPFIAGLFFKVLFVVVVLVTAAWSLVLWLMDYEVIPADYVGTVITTVLFSYLIHLWIMPTDHVMFDDESETEEE